MWQRMRLELIDLHTSQYRRKADGAYGRMAKQTTSTATYLAVSAAITSASLRRTSFLLTSRSQRLRSIKLLRPLSISFKRLVALRILFRLQAALAAQSTSSCSGKNTTQSVSDGRRQPTPGIRLKTPAVDSWENRSEERRVGKQCR